jgi:hypothetical protein
MQSNFQFMEEHVNLYHLKINVQYTLKNRTDK